MPLKKKELNSFKEILEKQREELLRTVESLKEQSIQLSIDDLPDEVDLASSESDQSMNLRLRDRERFLLMKISRAMEKIEEGTYGICENCSEDIGVKRLEARPVTDLCIRCKEEQEQQEKNYAE